MPSMGAARGRVRRPAAPAAPLYQQSFAASAGDGTSSNATFGINRPTEYSTFAGGNPIYPSLASTKHDLNAGYVSVADTGSLTHLFYTSWNNTDVGTYHQMSYANTDDGVTLTRPNLGLFSYPPTGETLNIMQPNYTSYRRSWTNPVWDVFSQRWVAIVHLAAPASPELWVSRDLRSWTLEKTFTEGSGYYNFDPGSGCFWRRSDNRAVVYYQLGVSGFTSYGGWRRNVGMLLGPAGGALTGTWTDQGAVLTAPSDDVQYYATGAFVHGNICWVLAGIFDGTDSVPTLGTFDGTKNCIHKIQLFSTAASDGITLTSRDSTWLNTSRVYGEWDGGEIIPPKTFSVRGDEWGIYVGGDGNTHHQATESIRSIGKYSIGRGRIGKAYSTTSNTGTWTSPLVSGVGSVFVNKSGGGSLRVELLDASNNVVSGFAESDCGTVPSDVYEWGVSWTGGRLTPSSFKVKVYLDTATLHNIEVRS